MLIISIDFSYPINAYVISLLFLSTHLIFKLQETLFTKAAAKITQKILYQYDFGSYNSLSFLVVPTRLNHLVLVVPTRQRARLIFLYRSDLSRCTDPTYLGVPVQLIDYQSPPSIIYPNPSFGQYC